MRDNLIRNLKYTRESFSVDVLHPGEHFQQLIAARLGTEQAEKAIAALQRIRAAVIFINETVRAYNQSNTHSDVAYLCDMELKLGRLGIKYLDSDQIGIQLEL